MAAFFRGHDTVAHRRFRHRRHVVAWRCSLIVKDRASGCDTGSVIWRKGYPVNSAEIAALFDVSELKATVLTTVRARGP